jgi:curved DNA-binding protein CbpA
MFMKSGSKSEHGDGSNYYEILEVSETAASHEIHKAYTRAKATYSSDNPALYSMFSPDEARDLLRLIEEAYSVLGNPSLRKSYDEARLRGENFPHVALVVNSSSQLGGNSATSAPLSIPVPAPVAPPVSLVQISQEHRALPDFTISEDHSTETEVTPSAPVAHQASMAKAPLPEGTGRTSLSTYKIDESFEEELKQTTEFDGRVLQRARLYKNITIDRLAEATRISRPYLTAVETNDYKALPAAVFTRGFVIQIARYLGLNEAVVASSYIKLFKAGGGK